MSFLSDYRDFSSGSEIPPVYTTFCSLVALSSIVSRRVWIDLGYFEVFPNLYVVLVGLPGNRKTSAMEVCEKLLQELKIPVSGECVTKEKLVLDIQAQEIVVDSFKPDDPHRIISPLTICASELSEFLGAGGIGMISFLTTIYGRGYYEYRTKGKGVTIVKGPYLNVLGCTTPDWITTYLRTDVISGGFSRRAIFVYETARSGRIAFPEVTPAMQAAWNRAVAHGRALNRVVGQFKWEDNAKKFYEAWYTSLRFPNDPNLVGYYETKHIQLLKLGMLIALSESTEMLLTTKHLEAGLAILGLAEYNLSRVFQGIGRNELNAAATKVQDFILNSPTRPIRQLSGEIVPCAAIPEKKLRIMLFKDVDTREMDTVLMHLKETGKIAVCEETSGNESRRWVYIPPE